jgi:hypothetical protein
VNSASGYHKSRGRQSPAEYDRPGINIAQAADSRRIFPDHAKAEKLVKRANFKTIGFLLLKILFFMRQSHFDASDAVFS